MGNFLLKKIKAFCMKRMFMQIIIFGMILLLFPTILLGSVTYYITTHNLERQSSEFSSLLVNNLQAEIDGIISNAMLDSLQISFDSNTTFFARRPFDDDRLKTSKIYQTIKSEISTRDYIDSIYIYYHHSGEVISNNGSFDAENFYDLDWYESGLARLPYGMPNTLLPARVITEKVGNAPGVQKRVVSWVSYLPWLSSEKSGGVVVNINCSMLEERLKKYIQYPENLIFVYDSQDDIVLTNKEELYGQKNSQIFEEKLVFDQNKGYIISDMSGEKQLISYSLSQKLGLRYVSVIPYRNITKNISFIKNMIIIWSLFLLLIGMGIVFGMGKKVYRPVEQLINDFSAGNKTEYSEQHRRKNEIDFLREKYENIYYEAYQQQEQNDYLKSQIAASKEAMIINFVRRLIANGEIVDEDTVKKMEMLNFPAGKYILMQISIDRYSEFIRDWNQYEQSRWKGDILKIAQKVISQAYRCTAYENEENEIIIIVHIPTTVEPAVASQIIRESAQQVRMAVSELIGYFTVSIAISEVGEDISLIGESYRGISVAMKRRWLYGGGGIYLTRENISSPSEIIFCTDIEQELLQAVKQAEPEKALMLLNRCINEILIKNQYDYHNVYNSVYHLIDAIYRFVQTLNYKSDDISLLSGYSVYEKYQRMETLEDTKDWINDLLGEAMTFISQKYGKKQGKLIQQVQQYIDDNYSEDLYLKGISVKFNISEFYLSRLFRQEVGKGFPEYLNMLRINKAKEQITKHPDIPLSNIAEEVGYRNVQTFIRVFKKYEGVTPSQYNPHI